MGSGLAIGLGEMLADGLGEMLAAGLGVGLGSTANALKGNSNDETTIAEVRTTFQFAGLGLLRGRCIALA